MEAFRSVLSSIPRCNNQARDWDIIFFIFFIVEKIFGVLKPQTAFSILLFLISTPRCTICKIRHVLQPQMISLSNQFKNREARFLNFKTRLIYPDYAVDIAQQKWLNHSISFQLKYLSNCPLFFELRSLTSRRCKTFGSGVG